MTNISATSLSWKTFAACGFAIVLGLLLLDSDTETFICQQSVALPYNRATVFKFISDMKTLPGWLPGVRKIEPVNTYPIGIGKQFTQTSVGILFGEVEYEIAIIGYESPRYVSYLSDSWLMEYVEIEVSRKESQAYPSMLTYTINSRRKSYFFKYFVAPFLKLACENRLQRALFSLRHRML